METLHQPQDIIANRYRIITLLGKGGTGITYEAEDLTNYQRVAIKVVSLRNIKDWKILELFEREANILAQLDHPAIPQYLNYFHIDTPFDRRFYLVRELVSGKSLADLVKQGWHANEAEVKRIGIQVLKILKYLQQLNPPVIHRDIKPENIIRRENGQIFLVDFGAVHNVYRHTLSPGSTFVGTVGYMPLEQLRGQVSLASDLYSLGATLIFLLTHRSPNDLPQVLMKIDLSRIPISYQFANWLEKMLEPAVEDRFQSATEAIQVLGGRSSRPVQQKNSLAGRMPTRQEFMESYTINLKIQQLTKKPLVLTRNERRLVIDIPPRKLPFPRRLIANIISFNLIVLPTVLLFNLKVLSVFWTIFFFLVISELFICLFYTNNFSDSLHIEIDLDQQTVLYEEKWYNCTKGGKSGYKENIDLNNSKFRYTSSKSKKDIIWSLVKTHPDALTAEEKKRLNRELSDFLKQMPS